MKERQGLCPVVRGCMYEGKTRVMSGCQRLAVCMYEGKTRVMSWCQRLAVSSSSAFHMMVALTRSSLP